MDTNFNMLKEFLDKYNPEQRGVVNIKEINLIKDTLHIGKMDVIQLRNLKDFTVLFMSKSNYMKDWDKMSAITHIIDMRISELGGEI